MDSTIDSYVSIDGVTTEKQRIPSEILTQVVEGFQRIAWILGAANEGQVVDKRFRPGSDLKERHMLEWGIPIPGSYVLPVYLSGIQESETDKNDLNTIYNIFTAVSRNDGEMFKYLVQDSRLRDRLLETLKKLLPKSWENWQIKYTCLGKEPTSLDSKSSVTVKSWSAKSFPRKQDETLTIKGDLLSIDFEANKVVVRYPPTHRSIECIYIPEIEDSILESRKELIEVTGRFILDENGHPSRLTEVSRIHPVDLSLMTFNQFEYEGRTLLVDPPLNFQPLLDEETSQLYVIKNDPIGVNVVAYTREDLMDILVEQVFFLWDTYGDSKVNETDLTEGALRRRKELRNRLKEKIKINRLHFEPRRI